MNKDLIKYLETVSGTGSEIKQINQAIQLYSSGEYENFLATLEFLDLMNSRLFEKNKLKHIRAEIQKLSFEQGKKAKIDFRSDYQTGR